MTVRGFRFLWLCVLLCLGQVLLLGEIKPSFFDQLPPHGYGILERIVNKTPYAIDFFFEKHIHDYLPQDSIVRIKNRELNAYYSLRMQKDGSYSIKADTTKPNDPAAHFVVERRFSPNLHSWIGFSHNLANRNMLQVDRAAHQLICSDREFTDEKAEKSHWEIIEGKFNSNESKIENCYLYNRAAQGYLYHFSGEIDVEVTPGTEDFREIYSDWLVSRVKNDAEVVALAVNLQHWENLVRELSDKGSKRSLWHDGGLFTRKKRLNKVIAERNGLAAALEHARKENGKIYRFDKKTNSWVYVPGCLAVELAVVGDDKVYARTEKKEVYVFNASKNQWDYIAKDIDHISALANGTFCYTSKGFAFVNNVMIPRVGLQEEETKIEYDSATNKEKKVVTKSQVIIKKSAVDRNGLVWAIGSDERIYQFAQQGDKTWKDVSAGVVGVVNILVAWDGNVWVVDKSGDISERKGDGWARIARQVPNKPRSVSLGNNKYALACSEKGELYRWDGRVWTKISAVAQAYVEAVGAASGAVTIKIPGKMEKRRVERASVFDQEGNATRIGAYAAVDIEIVKLGVGGGIDAFTTVNLGEIPVTKNPRVAGFAQETISNFDQSLLLSLMPLQSKGAAWLSSALTRAGEATVLFLGRAQSSGYLQIVLGSKVSDSYTYKIVIGDAGNTRAAIYKHGQGEPVFAVSREQNPLAAAIAGKFISYWISIYKGLILVGMGEPGENVFLSWRDPNPPHDISHIGFSSHKEKTEYTQIRIDGPVVAHAPSRIFFPMVHQKSPVLAINPSPSSITWSPYPFRIKDEGSIKFDIVGKDQASIVLSADNSIDVDHYVVVFGEKDSDGKAGFAIKRYDSESKTYKIIYFVHESVAPQLALNPQKWKRFWLSFNTGEFILGEGEFGENILVFHRDFVPLLDIRSIGFAAFGAMGMRIANIFIASSLSMGILSQEDVYKKESTAPDFKGSVEIILPFDYEFKQDKDRIALRDHIRKSDHWAGDTPERGSFYYYEINLAANGALGLVPSREADRRGFYQYQRELWTIDARQELIQAQQALIKERGLVDEAKKGAEAVRTEAAQQDSENLSRLAMESSAYLGTYGSIVSMGALATHAAVVGLTGQLAAKKRLEGRQAALGAEERALAYNEKIAQDIYQRRLMESEASLAFSGSDRYIYTDAPAIPDLGSGKIPDWALQNRQLLDNRLKELEGISDEYVDYLLTQAADMLQLINHYAVVNDAALEKRLFSFVERIYKLSLQAQGLETQFLEVLFGFFNNSYAVNESSSAHRVEKNRWFVWINEIGRRLIQQGEFELAACFGEYIWHPQKFVHNNQGTVTLQIQGGNDLFLSFTNDIRHKVRNSGKDLYEVVVGAWDNNGSLIRIESLGKPVERITFAENNFSTLNPHGFIPVWVTYNNGEIYVGRGEPGQNVILSWKDPYPIQNIRYIGLSSWNSPLQIKNFEVHDYVPANLTMMRRKRATRNVPIGEVSAQSTVSLELLRTDVEVLAEEPENAGNVLESGNAAGR